MLKEAQKWFNEWENLKKNYVKMHLFKFTFVDGKIKYYYMKKDKENLIYQLQAINESLRTHRERIDNFFKTLNYNTDNLDWHDDRDNFSIFLTHAHYFINDTKIFWTLFNKIYDKEKLLKENDITINFNIFDVISFLRKIVDHPTDIRLHNTNKDLLKNSKYLKPNFDINQLVINEIKLYLNYNYTILDKSKEQPLLAFFHKGITGEFSFNSSKYKINFDTHEIIGNFLKKLAIYCDNCIKIEKILNKNKTKYLKISKKITKNPKVNIAKPIKNKIYDFNQKDNPLYEPNLQNTWTLIIERKKRQIRTQTKIRKEFFLTYQKGNEKPFKSRSYGINFNHKGCAMGKLIDDLLDNNDKITLKNLRKMPSYSIEQPDGLLISIYLVIKNPNEKYIIKNYLNEVWFKCFDIKTKGRDLMELEFPWGFIETYMPFDERIGNFDYRRHIFLFSYYQNNSL